jgi:hypothetical protein
MSRYRAFYGAHPLHLLTMLAGFAVLGYVVATLTPKALWNPHVWWQSIAVWFAVAIIAHDLVLFPLYALADRLLTIPADRWAHRPARSAINYIRLPLLASALTFVVFLPGIIEQGAPTYQAATGQTQEPFLGRWLLLAAAMFGASAAVYAVRAVRTRRRRVTDQP